jgi:alkylation response protein AidB-like acyl-CoA dehydrogenase
MPEKKQTNSAAWQEVNLRPSVPTGPPTYSQQYIAQREAKMAIDSQAAQSLWNAPRERKAAQARLQQEAEDAMAERKRLKYGRFGK